MANNSLKNIANAFKATMTELDSKLVEDLGTMDSTLSGEHEEATADLGKVADDEVTALYTAPESVYNMFDASHTAQISDIDTFVSGARSGVDVSLAVGGEHLAENAKRYEAQYAEAEGDFTAYKTAFEENVGDVSSFEDGFSFEFASIGGDK